MSRFLDIDEITAACATVIKEATPEDRLFMRSWVVQACRDIGPNRNWVKICSVKNKGGFLDKPGDMTALIDMALFTQGGVEIPYKFQPSQGQRIHVDRFQVQEVTSENTVVGLVEVSEDAHYFTLGSNGSDVNYALVRYFAMPTDRDGLPLIEEDNLIAYMMYVRWMWAMRKNDNRSEIDQNYQMWLIERDRVKGGNKMPNMKEADAIARSWFSLINSYHSPNF